MQICKIEINNFRGIKYASILLPNHAVLIGENNVGKTTILEAINLVLGPDRLNRFPPINEHDFFRGEYLSIKEEDISPEVKEEKTSEQETSLEDENSQIKIDVAIINFNEEQKAYFLDDIEFWNTAEKRFYNKANLTDVDCDHIQAAIRVTFLGQYDEEEDDFQGNTYFTRSLEGDEEPRPFKKKDKQKCGFLYLRSIRTGTRALSLERGSLLDIILRLKELRPKMWESTLERLASHDVAGDPVFGISGVLESINLSLRKYVPREWSIQPSLKVSKLTREHLREVITSFIATGEGNHAAPFYRQGAGSLNMLVLAMLSQIAEDKQNVIFGMEEPETALPPYAQKRIVREVRKLSAQTIFTSHSPYVLEEFSIDETVILQRDIDSNKLNRMEITFPDNMKPNYYRREFQSKFCEGLLTKRILITEGATEAQAFPAVCRRLEEIDSERYMSLEALGICVIDSGGDDNISNLVKFYSQLNKDLFVLCDKQSNEDKNKIENGIKELFMHDEKGFEDLILKHASEDALKRFAAEYNWPSHLKQNFPNPSADIQNAMKELFKWKKGNWIVADFLAQCEEAEVPEWLRITAHRLKQICEPPIPATDNSEEEKNEQTKAEVSNDGSDKETTRDS